MYKKGRFYPAFFVVMDGGVHALRRPN